MLAFPVYGPKCPIHTSRRDVTKLPATRRVGPGGRCELALRLTGAGRPVCWFVVEVESQLDRNESVDVVAEVDSLDGSRNRPTTESSARVRSQ